MAEVRRKRGYILFIRTVTYGRSTKKEGIYSPITQNKRHLELLKQIRSAQKTNIVLKTLFEKYFYDNYCSVVVLANPKTIVTDRYAPKAVKSQVIRADQLIEHIKKVNAEPEAVASSEKDIEQLARFYLGVHNDEAKDYFEKYRNMIAKSEDDTAKGIGAADLSIKNEEKLLEEAAQTIDEPEQVFCPKCGAPMIRRKATKGKNVGEEFWGCSTFPKCRSIVNI